MNFKTLIIIAICALSIVTTYAQDAPLVTNAKGDFHSNYRANIENFSGAAKRNMKYMAEYPPESELYTQFRYTEIKGLDYNGGDGTISRRDPSKVIFENGKYYVWYTHRHTVSPPDKTIDSDIIPTRDWDLSEIWYATSEDGITWEEQGVAIPRPAAPALGCRSVSTSDILKFKGKYYLYYQAYTELSPTSGDYCKVTMSSADNPDGPWTPCGKVVVSPGGADSWDPKLIHDPFPLVHDGQIYIYYKSGLDHREAAGLAICDNPEGPFEKYENNPIMFSGHEVSLFPFKEGVAAIVIKDGNEHYTIQYAEDWKNFEIASITALLPNAPAGFIPDAFDDNGNGRGITWGMCHFIAQGDDRNYSRLDRFEFCE